RGAVRARAGAPIIRRRSNYQLARKRTRAGSKQETNESLAHAGDGRNRAVPCFADRCRPAAEELLASDASTAGLRAAPSGDGEAVATGAERYDDRSLPAYGQASGVPERSAAAGASAPRNRGSGAGRRKQCADGDRSVSGAFYSGEPDERIGSIS